MNSGIRKLAVVLVITLVSLTGCQSLDFVEPDTTVYSHDYQDAYGLAVSVKGYYVVYGKLSTILGSLKAGECILTEPAGKHNFYISKLVEMYPNLQDPRVQKAIVKQGTESVPFWRKK